VPPKRASARPKVTLKFLIWDVTAPDDSLDFAQRMQKILHWRNLLDGAPSTLSDIKRPKTQKYPRGGIPLFMPCGSTGKDWSSALLDNALLIRPKLFDPKHNSFGHPNIFYVSSHGLPGFLFSESGVMIGTSSIIGKPGNPTRGVVPKPSFQWDSPNLKYVIFAACRQLDGKQQQALWARAMRSHNPLHGILGYHDTSPAPVGCIPINRRFVQELSKGRSILEAWRKAHEGGSYADNWAALIHESALNDSVTQWSQTGTLASSPSPSGIIRYFDSENPDGREVTEPVRFIDMSFQNTTDFGAGSELPPWIYALTGNVGILNFNLTEASGTSFEPGDRVRVASAQVRPDYPHPFDITKVFSFVLPSSDTLDQHKIKVLFDIHYKSLYKPTDTNLDTYEFSIPARGSPEETRMNSWFRIQNSRNIQLKVKIGDFSNEGYSLFYLMGQLKKADGRVFGIPERSSGETEDEYQRKLADDFQFAVFGIVRP
jgi:hypothetical protein